MADNISITPEAQKAIRDRDQRIADLECDLGFLDGALADTRNNLFDAEARLAKVKEQRNDAIADSARQAVIVGYMGDKADKQAQRIAELEAKLVRVAGIVESNLTPVYDEYGNGEVSLVGPCLELCVENTEKLRAILSDTRNPLAVVKCGFDPSQCEWPSGSIEMLVDCTDGYNPTDDGFVPVTVIVMPRESEGE